MTWRSLVAVGALVAVAGCGDKAASADESGEAGTSEGTESDEGEDEGGDEPIFARGIRADYVEVNQGVAVPIVDGGQWIGPADRTSSVYSGRTTLIRVPWQPAEDFEPREIEAHLIIDSSVHEQPLVVKQTKMISEPSHPGSLDRNFAWVVPGEEMVAGLKFRVELYEVNDNHADEPEPDPLPITPTGGSELLGIEEFPMELKVVLVPVDYTSDGNCKTLAVPDETQAAQFEQWLFERNAVQNVDFRIHETPIVRTGTLTTLSTFFEPLQQYRAMDGAEPNEYYYALVNACAGGVGGAGGIANGTPPATKQAANGRVSVGLWLPNGPNFSYETFVHEIGHSQGRAHTFCPGGGADFPDSQFPNENGKLGVWGFGVETFSLRSPTAHFDYMSYCNPTWVSDYNWVMTGKQIKTLTAWDYEDDYQPPVPVSAQQQILAGLLKTDGTEQWWTTVGGVDEARVGDEIVFETADGKLSTPASHKALEDGTIYVTAVLPTDIENVFGITRRAGPDASSIEVGSVSVQPRSWDEYLAAQ